MSATSSKLPTVARVLLGLPFVVFGLNGFLGFLPQPEHPGPAGAFLGALAATGYMFPLIKGTELVAGALILGNRLVPFALVLLAPVLVNIVAFHAAFEPATLGLPLALTALEIYLAWANRAAYAPLFARGTGSSARVPAPRPAHAA